MNGGRNYKIRTQVVVTLINFHSSRSFGSLRGHAVTRSVYCVGLYAGNPVASGDTDGVYSYTMSDNSSSADNQQERFPRTFSTSELSSYLTGFADGEGSFNISFRKRRDYKFHWKVSACFNVSQKEKKILEIFQQHLGCGTLRSRPDGVWYYEVNTLDEICTYVIPFFLRNPFLSQKKQRDFLLFQKIVNLLSAKFHLFEDGVKEILNLRREMNDGGKRKYSEQEILNAYQENPQRLHARLTLAKASDSEDIVRSHGRP